MNSNAPVGLTWIAAAGFIRITTNHRIMAHPLPAKQACSCVQTWLARPVVSILQPGPRHADLLFGFLENLGTAGNLTTDAQLAAIAVEFQAELQSTDADFSRFPGLKWKNPLA
jgi:toxin-antitoxin system PIN domain toxin